MLCRSRVGTLLCATAASLCLSETTGRTLTVSAALVTLPAALTLGV